MELVGAIAERSVILFGALLLLAQLACYETGYWFGCRDRTGKAEHTEAVGVVVGGMLGLLAFVLALTLSFANARFAERQAGGVAEANAIGTAWLRAKAIGGSSAETIATILEEYTQVRVDFIRANGKRETVDALNERTNALQSQIWGHLAVIVRDKSDPVSNSLMTAINDTFDASTVERFAFNLRLPPQLLELLIVMTLLSMGFLGYQLGLRERPVRILVALLTLMWTAVLVDILDLASPRLGYLRAGTAAYEWTLQGFKGGLSIPENPGRP